MYQWAGPISWEKWIFQIFKVAQTYKFKMEAFLFSKKFQTLHGARIEYFEQLSQLDQLQNPNRIHVINSRTYSNLKLLWILKGFEPCGKNMVNSLKFYLDLLFLNLNSVGHTCMPEIGVLIQVPKWLDLKIRNEFEFENSNHTTLIIQTNTTGILFKITNYIASYCSK
jgi:hypothetical protein